MREGAKRHGMTQRDLSRDEHERELGFKPRPAVRWLSLSQLVSAGLQVGTATLFADFSDRRESQAIFPQRVIPLPQSDENVELWLDFAADLGDGFDATLTVASLLGRPELAITTPEGGTVTLPRGAALVLGGDEVYPTASAEAYEDRMLGPYRAAAPAGEHPDALLFALPGNHDWYDGLTSFLRIFTRRQVVGSWQTVQSRSYFALKLRPGWWLVALDSQLGEYIDGPQLDYFDEALRDLKPGDSIVFCSASPTWETTAYDADAFNSLHYFAENYLLNRRDPDTGALMPTGAEIRLWLSGDHHHYSRYEERPPGAQGAPVAHDPRATQLMACGLGGAYLMGTDRLAESLELPPRDSRMKTKSSTVTDYDRGEVRFPDPALERRLHWASANPFSKYWLPTRNPWFGTGMSVLYLVLFVVLAGINAGVHGTSLGWAVKQATVADAAWLVAWAVALPVIVLLVVWVVNALRTGRRPGGGQVIVGVLVQLALVCGLFIGMRSLPWWDHVWLAVPLLIVAVLGYVIGSEAFALFVCLVPPGSIGDYKMTGLAYEDGKGFVRMHFTAEGDLELYPILVDEVVHEWTLVDDEPRGLKPAPASGLPQPRLLEHPIRIARHGFGSTGTDAPATAERAERAEPTDA
ncbi:hypothetical protein GCM10027568_24910 [Humibacter soli]